MGHSFNFVYNPETSIQKSIKRASKPSKPTILAKQAKQASLRCQKLQASKLTLLSLARLLIHNSDLVHPSFIWFPQPHLPYLFPRIDIRNPTLLRPLLQAETLLPRLNRRRIDRQVTSRP